MIVRDFTLPFSDGEKVWLHSQLCYAYKIITKDRWLDINLWTSIYITEHK